MTIAQTKAANARKTNLGRLLKWKYSPSLFFSGANTLCSVAFQFGILFKLGVGARSDLYFASVVTPVVVYTLAFGALNNVLVPMFVEAKAQGDNREIVLLWNCLLVTSVGASLLLILLPYPVLLAFPLMFRKLAWIDLRQVTSVLLFYSFYQVLYLAVLTKNCFLFAQGRPVSAQTGVFCGWAVSLFLLWQVHPVQNLGQIPFCLVAGNAVALLFPTLERGVFFYRRGLLKQHTISLFKRTWPVTAGCSVGWVEPAFDGIIASALTEGSLTIYYFFSRMMLYAAMSIFSGYIQPVTKHLAELAATDSLGELRRQTRKVVVNGVLLGLGILVIGVLGLLLLRTAGIPVVQRYVLMFSHKLPVFFLLIGYLFGMLGYAGYSNSLYVLGRERLFMVASFIVFPAGMIAKFLGARMFGLEGLAAGTSVYWLSYAVSLLFCFSLAMKQRQTDAVSSTYPGVLQEQRIEL
jgi:hypothetical protein